MPINASDYDFNIYYHQLKNITKNQFLFSFKVAFKYYICLGSITISWSVIT